MIKPFLQKVASGQDLSRQEMETAMDIIMTGGATEAQIGGFITGLRIKGETADEIAGAATIMRKRATKISPKTLNGNTLLDTCGTGGDGRNTFNISTATAFVAAGAGAVVAKHGNRGVSSRSGSADVLEALDVAIDIEPGRVEESIDRVGIGFLFAPRLHAAMKHVGPTRKELGIRTIFNVLGPLTNPAGAQAQLVGVYDPDLCPILARVLLALGTRRAMVVHGDGLDEISTTGPTRVSSVQNGAVEHFVLDAGTYGLKPSRPEELSGGTPADNAAVILDVLSGKPGPRRDVVLLNAAAALSVSGIAPDIGEGLVRAAESIDSGAALKKLNQLREFTSAAR
jgi:anthranilate phosphoribosyltransferase